MNVVEVLLSRCKLAQSQVRECARNSVYKTTLEEVAREVKAEFVPQAQLVEHIEIEVEIFNVYFRLLRSCASDMLGI